MKNKLAFSLGAAAAIAIVGSSAPANAFSFGSNGIGFNEDTTVQFTFRQSNNAFQSTLQIFEVLGGGTVAANNGVLFTETKASDNGWRNGYKGTLGNAVSMVNETFTFLAGKVYTLGLVSTYNGINAGTVFSTSSLNSQGVHQAVFGSSGGEEAQAFDATPFQTANPFNGPQAIAFEDIRGGGDGDFNDFSVTAEAVPEPFTIGGLALGAAGLAAARRRRNRQTSEAQ